MPVSVTDTAPLAPQARLRSPTPGCAIEVPVSVTDTAPIAPAGPVAGTDTGAAPTEVPVSVTDTAPIARAGPVAGTDTGAAPTEVPVSVTDTAPIARAGSIAGTDTGAAPIEVPVSVTDTAPIARAGRLQATGTGAAAEGALSGSDTGAARAQEPAGTHGRDRATRACGAQVAPMPDAERVRAALHSAVSVNSPHRRCGRRDTLGLMSRRAPARATLASSTLASVTLAALLAALPAPARAKATLQGTATATAGWTDNVLNAPDEKTTNGPARESDFLFQLIPGAVLVSVAPRFLQRVAYNFTADLFARHSEANSYSNTLDWAADVLTSPNSSVIFTLQSQQGRLSTFNLNQPSAGAMIAVLPQNANINYFNQTAGESFEVTPTAKWRVLQTLLFRAFIPIDRGTMPDSYDLVGEVGFDRIFRLDALGLVLRADFVDYVAPRDPMTHLPIGFDQKQVLTTLLARWRRDWSSFWSSEAALGVVAAVGSSSDPMATTQHSFEPSALAALRWSKDLGAAELRYAHEVAPNPLAGSTFSTDEVALQGSLPIVAAKLYLSATVAYQHARLLSLAAGVPTESANLVLTDFTIGWQPIPELGLFARYSFYDQFGKPPVMDMPATLPDLTRNVVMVGVNVIYPAVAAARVPSRQGSRIDRSDQAGFPELHAPQPR